MTDTNFEAETTAKAAESGASATEGFLERSRATSATSPVDHARVSRLAGRAIQALNDIVIEEKITYPEYNALKAWLIKVGEDGEWPLFLDVWLEHSVEEVASEHRKGSKGTIEGPYYVSHAPEHAWDGTISMRENEPGTPLLFSGLVSGVDGTPIANARIEVWHADDLGYYSQFAPGVPEWNLRGVFITNHDGAFAINTIRPAAYQIPTEGACGVLINAAGWHAWRPAHIHLKVSAPGYELITTQLYFPGDPHNEDDIASAVKPELLLEPKPRTDSAGQVAIYDFTLDQA